MIARLCSGPWGKYSGIRGHISEFQTRSGTSLGSVSEFPGMYEKPWVFSGILDIFQNSGDLLESWAGSPSFTSLDFSAVICWYAVTGRQLLWQQ